MKSSLSLSFLVLSLCVCCTNDGRPEKARDQGHGFWILSQTKKSNGWEAVIFSTAFGYRNQTLCDNSGYHCVAPSGQYALYQHGPSGDLFIYSTRHGSASKVNASFPGLPREVSWQESQFKVVVQFGEGKPSATYNLPK